MNKKLMSMTLLAAVLAAALGSVSCQRSGATGPASHSPGLTSRVRPAHASDESLAGISCTSESDCSLVGTRSRPDKANVSLAGRWTGSQLSLAPGPNIKQGGHLGGKLTAVTCPNARDCWAAGRYNDPSVPFGTPFFARWNGTAWSAVAAPLPRHSDPSTAAISALACASATDCWAVGYVGRFGSGGPRFAPLVVHWNGLAWSLAPAPGQGTISDLSAVSCPAAGDCWAIGSWAAEPQHAKGGTLTEHWNGARWAVVHTPTSASGPAGGVAGLPTVAVGPAVTRVSCAGPAACVAVGTWHGEHAFAERWTGSAWVLARPPEPGGSLASGFDGVSCVTARWCVAVGSSYIAATGKDRVLVERWNGAAWTIVPAPAPAGATRLGDVSCVTTRACVTVGDTGSGPFLDHWNGHLWTIAAT